MSVELTKKRIPATGVKAAKKPHRKSHTEFDVKRNLPKAADHALHRIPRKTLKDQSLALEFEETSCRKGAPSEKSAQLATNKLKRKPSVDMYSEKENMHPNLAYQASKQKTKSKGKLVEQPPESSYQSMRQTVEVIRSELQQLSTQTLTIEQQNRVLYKQIHAVEQTQQLNKFLQEQTKKKMDELEKMCVRNEKTLAQLQSQLQKHSQQSLSAHEKDSMSTNYRQVKGRPKKGESNKKDTDRGKVSCIALADSIRRKLVR